MRVQPRSGSKTDSIQADLVEQYLERLQAGETLDPSEFAAQYPEHAEALRQLLPALQMMAELSNSALRNRSSQPASEAISPPELGILGDFHVLREVGRGGMGVVYEAEQLSLHRRVALKVLPLAGGLDPRQLQRFKTEAQAAALLHHTNIVPIHAVGCERGVHYYAMQFIDGQTLAQVINERKSIDQQAHRYSVRSESPDSSKSPRAVTPTLSSRTREFIRPAATLGIQAAEALDHAHVHGVIHRDIKPANLMLDAAGRLWITDFGLARLHDDTGLTMTGDLLGTLRYMSPEQALAKRGYLDHRTDIYSLGATLYELLTLRSAIDGQDRQEVLRKIAQEEPIAPRKLDPAIPRELETIVLKAMNKEPQSRYAAAQELADDLRRFLDDKPIAARRPTLLERVGKWSRRHTHAVVSLISVLVLALVGLTVGATLLGRKQVDVVRQRDRARRAVDEMYTEVAQQWLSQQPQLEPLQREFLLKALAFYQDFARDLSADPAARAACALAEMRAGQIQLRLGDTDSAQSASRRAVRLQGALAADFPNVAEYRRVLSESYHDLGRSLSKAGRLADAESAHRRAVELGQQLLAESHQHVEFHGTIANAANDLGTVLREMGRLNEAESAHLQAVEHGEALLAAIPRDRLARSSLANCHYKLGWLYLYNHMGRDAEPALRRALELLEALVAEFPRDPEYRAALANSYNNLHNRLNDTGRGAEAETSRRSALKLHESLAAEFPRVPDYRAALAIDYFNQANELRGMAREAEAESAHRQALGLRQARATEFPSVPDYRKHLYSSLNNLGSLLSDTGRLQEAESARRRGLELIRGLAAEFPNVPDYQSSLGAALNNLGLVLRDMGQLTEARSLYERAIIHQKAALNANPRGWQYRGFLRNHYKNLASTLVRLRDHAAAAQATEELVRAGLNPAEDLGAAVESLVACARLAEADSRLSTAERLVQSRGYLERAEGLAREAVAGVASGEDPRLLNGVAWFLATCTEPRFRDPARAVELARKAAERAPHAGTNWETLGVARYRAGDWTGALEALEKSMQLSNGGRPADWFFLAMAHWQKGDKGTARSAYDKAVQWMEKNKSQDDKLRSFRAETAALLGVTDQPTLTTKKEENAKQRSNP
jgi:serine/threonine protein kinase